MFTKPVTSKNQPSRWMLRLVVAGLTDVLLLAGLALLVSQLALASDEAQEQPPVSWIQPARAFGPQQPADLQWYSTQLHLHAWSNHNAGLQPGSIQLHQQHGAAGPGPL